MASELRVNSSTNRSGLGTITYTDSGPIVSGVGTFANGLTVDGTQTTVKSLKLTGDSYNVNWFKTTHKLRFNDNAKATFGTADDLSIFHDGTNSNITNATNDLNITNTGDDIVITANDDINLKTNSGDNGVNILGGAAVELYYNASKKFQTTNTGVSITGTTTSSGSITVTSGNITASDGGVLINGAGGAILYLNDSNDNPDYQVQNIGGAFAIKDGTNNVERLHINSTGQMGLGVSPSRHLDIKDSTGANRIVNIRGTGTSGAFLAFLDANTTDDSKCRVGSIGGNSIGLRGDAHHFQNGAGTDRMVIDSSGRLLIGTTASRTTNSHVPALQVSGTSYHKSTVQIINNANDSTGAYLFLGKQRSGSAGGNTIVQNNDIVGQIRFSVADGTDMENQCAQIQATVDGVPGSNDTPGRLSFYTTPDNSTTLTERLRIASTGQSLFRVSGSQTTPINDGNVPVQIAETTGSMCYFGANKGSSYGSLFGHHTAFGGTVIRNILSDDIAFYTNNTSRKMTIRNNGNVEIENGDLKVASGHGIDFSSTGDASGMSSELLDDYEEGTWTPTASGFTISTTYSARYTKIGRLVHINCYLQAATGTGTSQQPHVGGLPFTSVGGNTYSYGAGRIGTGSYNNSQVDIVFQQQSSSTNVKLYVGGGGINEAMMSGGHVIFSMVYEAA